MDKSTVENGLGFLKDRINMVETLMPAAKGSCLPTLREDLAQLKRLESILNYSLKLGIYDDKILQAIEKRKDSFRKDILRWAYAVKKGDWFSWDLGCYSYFRENPIDDGMEMMSGEDLKAKINNALWYLVKDGKLVRNGQGNYRFIKA